MAAPIQHEDMLKLKSFVDFVNTNPTVLNMPQLQFVKDLIEKFGGKVPAGDFKMPETGSKCPFGGNFGGRDKPTEWAAGVDAHDSDKSDKDLSTSEPESDVELDMEGVIEADYDIFQPMGDSRKIPTEKEVDQAANLRSQAAASYREQKFDEAIIFYTKAIELNPGNSLFHAKRGQAFLKLKKPNACIKDCDKALELNCDSAAAYKFRGRARRLLGQFEEAAKDLRQACKLDFDEEADEWLREVTPNAKKIEQHRIKQERTQAERRVKDSQRVHDKAKKDQKQDSAGGSFPGAAGFSSACGGIPVGFDMGELLSKIKDPEVAAAMQDILDNPANISEYASNPKIFNLIKNIFPGEYSGGEPTGDSNEARAFSDAYGNKPAQTNKPTAKESDYVDDGLD